MRFVNHLLVCVLMAASFWVPGTSAQASPVPERNLTLNSVVSGLSVPVDLRAPEGDDRLFVVELTGKIRIFDNGSLRSTPFLDMSAKVSTGGERGLLGLAFHPDYNDNELFYIYYTDGGGDVRISELEVSSDPNVANASSERILLEVDEPYSNHNGGGLTFGPSGYLYIALGDGGGGGDPDENGQNTNTLLGSLLRIDVDSKDSGKEYSIPDSNPFASGGGLPEIFAFGLRNPWRISADHTDGLIYIGDVGESRREEINVLSDTGTSAVNFGWDVLEGTLCYEPASGCNKAGKTPPILEYNNPSEGVSVIGGYVYRGQSISWLRGTYFYSDLSGKRLKSFRYDDGDVTSKKDWTSDVGLLPASVYAFGEDGFGELYVLSGSTVFRIEDADPYVCDFNGDGDDDLAVGSPGEDVNGLTDVGSVLVLPASGGKPSGASDQLWHQGIDGIKGVEAVGEGFGSSLACGDFDGDGFDDLAVGTPGDRTGSGVAGGAVNVLFGSGSGLSTRDQHLHQSSPGVSGKPESGDEFGGAVAAGDFNGDGYDDLAIGVPGEDVQGLADAGMIHVLYGADEGLESAGSIGWTQDSPGVRQKSEPGDHFGGSLVAGDFNGDGYVDLGVGAPDEGINGRAEAGLVQVFKGRPGGLSVAGDLVFHQGSTGIKESVEAGDHFGAALAASTINADGYDDLLVGVPGESVGGVGGGGAVHYIRGSKGGPTEIGDRLITQESDGIKGSSESGDSFGSALTAGDVDGDHFGDLIVGIPNEDAGGATGAGAVAVIHGFVDGLSGRDQLWHEDTAGIKGNAEVADNFGRVLMLRDFAKDGILDLVIGIPSEDLAGLTDAGDVAVLFGNAGSISAEGDIRLNQGSPGVKGNVEADDRLGAALGG